MDNSFKIKLNNNDIIISKNESTFSIEKGIDEDIWFCSLEDEFKLSLKEFSRNQNEFACFIIFENLMKSIMGRYFLTGEYNKKFSLLPKDFIDLENKTITWHSDGEHDNILQLHYDNEEIVISIIKDNKIRNKLSNTSAKIRIRTSGSNYGYYYQEFERIYQELSRFADSIKVIKEQDCLVENNTPSTKKLSLLNRFRNKRCQ